ncbi:ArnT family glycosyltransferase [Nocardia bovistercoris]|uniref:Glycosyltransferase family 39 protein n=1 Tax=Nocardia bovistercoris TaxID=2785916 RepID=A0A931IDX9_9NOCA|nr:glycosyltransferase family 39 protein [Nocardia bovistercoris]MBH0779679.1 glycosyltransferase family 39 protein [Nocardia bovistercoris]
MSGLSELQTDREFVPPALEDRQETDPRPPFARTGVWSVAAVAAGVLLFSAGRYGYFGDELYFLAAGRRPAFGYADQGPALPLLARFMDILAPGSYFVLRWPSVLLTVLAIVLTAVIAREFGGGRAAQTGAALAYATSPFLLLQGKMLTTNAVDTALWVVITWLVVCWVRTRRDLLLFAAALVTAIDMQVKWLIPFFWICVVSAALLVGPRALARRPLLWLGGAIVVAATVPQLVWQSGHGWPQLRMGEVISGEQGILGGRVMFVPLGILLAGCLGAVVLLYGGWALLRHASLRPYRFLGVAAVALTLIFLALGGRVYYMAGMYAVVLAAGAVGLVEFARKLRPTMRRGAVVSAALFATAATGLVLYDTPWRSPERIAPPRDDAEAAINIGVYGEFGWPELTAAVDEVYAGMPPAEQERAVLLTDTYWQASALDQLGRDRLPPVHSASRGFGYFGAPADSASAVIAVGVNEGFLRWNFDEIRPAGAVDTRLGYPGNTQGVTVWVCTGRRHPWSEVWTDLMHL